VLSSSFLNASLRRDTATGTPSLQSAKPSVLTLQCPGARGLRIQGPAPTANWPGYSASRSATLIADGRRSAALRRSELGNTSRHAVVGNRGRQRAGATSKVYPLAQARGDLASRQRHPLWVTTVHDQYQGGKLDGGNARPPAIPERAVFGGLCCSYVSCARGELVPRGPVRHSGLRASRRPDDGELPFFSPDDPAV